MVESHVDDIVVDGARKTLRDRLDPNISEEFILYSMTNVFGYHGIGMSFQLEF